MRACVYALASVVLLSSPSWAKEDNQSRRRGENLAPAFTPLTLEEAQRQIRTAQEPDSQGEIRDDSLAPNTDKGDAVPPVEGSPPGGADASEQMSQEEIIQKIEELEKQIIILKKAAGVDRKGVKIALPKNGIYVQGDIGWQQREFAGENGITNLIFDPGVYGAVSLGYRYDRNWRFSFEYSSMNNPVSQIRPGVPLVVTDPVLGPVGNNGAQFPADGDVKLESYTFNVFYDLNGFGFERRFRPYVGAGLGFMTSTITGLKPSFFSAIGVDRELNGQDTSPVFSVEAGLSYLFNRKTEFYLAGKYFYASTFLFENTDFGTLMPNGARSWIIKTGARYAF